MLNQNPHIKVNAWEENKDHNASTLEMLAKWIISFLSQLYQFLYIYTYPYIQIQVQMHIHDTTPNLVLDAISNFDNPIFLPLLLPLPIP